MAPPPQSLKWLNELTKYGHLAYETGKKLEFFVIKRPNYRKWRISLNTIVSNGEEEFEEED